MPRSLVPFALLLLLAVGPSAAGADPVTLDRASVDTAIERGVEYLVDEQRPQGTWGPSGDPLGHTALVAFTLLHSGVAEDDGTPAGKKLARAFRYLDRNGPGRAGKRDKPAGTYATSLLLLTFRSRGRASDRPRMQRLTDILCKTQSKNGQWWYQDKSNQPKAVGDNSNTQFAMLALGVAHGEGLDVPKATIQRAYDWWLKSPQTDGGFGYCSGGSLHSASTGSMTAAGIACLAIGRTILEVPAAKAETDARAFLARVFDVKRNHGPAQGKPGQRQRSSGRGWLHYYLWTVERAMVLAERALLGKRDWYKEGALRLLETQKKDGSWRGEHPLYATCFALLFLTRAADPPRAFTPREKPVHPGGKPPVTPAPDDPEAPADDVPGKTPGDAPVKGTVAEWLTEALPPGELAKRCLARGPSSLRPLVRALRARDRKVRQRAFEALSALLPDERVARVDRHPLPRGRLALWLRQNWDLLVPRDGRFVLP